MLIAYDGDGNIVATQDHACAVDDDGRVTGLIDFMAHEEAGGEMTDIWVVDTHDPGRPVKGSKVWPEWLGHRTLEYKVELDGPPGQKRISALVHGESGHRRERAAIDAAIAERIAAAGDGPADIRDLVGGPDRPLHLDEQGRPIPRDPARHHGSPAHLPIVGIERGTP
jgi:hypothetical protein